MSNRATNLPAFLTFVMDITTSGTPEQLTKKLVGTGIAFNSNGDFVQDTITDSNSSFLTAGFAAGDHVTVSGSASNDGTYTVATAAAGTLTLIPTDSLTTEAAGTSFKLIAPVDVPDGIDVRIKAVAGNTGNIHIADSSAKALNTASASFVLDANESLAIQVASTNLIWLDASVSGESVQVIFEKELQG